MEPYMDCSPIHTSRISFPISFKLCQPLLNHGLMSLADCSGPPERAPRQPYWSYNPIYGKIIRQTYGGDRRGRYCSACIRKGVVTCEFDFLQRSDSIFSNRLYDESHRRPRFANASPAIFIRLRRLLDKSA